MTGCFYNPIKCAACAIVVSWVAAVIAWLASAPAADALRGGRHVDAQRVCEERQLIAGFQRAEGR